MPWTLTLKASQANSWTGSTLITGSPCEAPFYKQILEQGPFSSQDPLSEHHKQIHSQDGTSASQTQYCCEFVSITIIITHHLNCPHHQFVKQQKEWNWDLRQSVCLSCTRFHGWFFFGLKSTESQSSTSAWWALALSNKQHRKSSSLFTPYPDGKSEVQSKRSDEHIFLCCQPQHPC